ncbi:MAG: hypothetical protein V1804_04345 [Patescibacteria group bacterium]
METVGKDELANRLFQLLKVSDPNDLDDAMEKAKKLLTEAKEDRDQKLNEYESLFDLEMGILKKRGCPSRIIEIIQSYRDSVTHSAESLIIPKENIPFLPIIPPLFLGYHGLMSMVRTKNGKKKGQVYLSPRKMRDSYHYEDSLTILYDVEDGTRTKGMDPLRAKGIIQGQQARTCLSTHEVINLCIFSDLPQISSRIAFRFAPGSWYMSSSAESQYLSAAEVPVVSMDIMDHDGPRLECRKFTNEELYGTPSAGKFMELLYDLNLMK